MRTDRKDGPSSSVSPGVEVTSMSNTVGKADRTGYHLKALQEIRNSLLPFATENGGGGSPSPTLPKDGPGLGNYQAHLYHPYSTTNNGYLEVRKLSSYIKFRHVLACF